MALSTPKVRLREGGTAFLLSPRDAHRVYQRVHQVDCCVLGLPGVVVALDPRHAAEPARRQTRAIAPFVRYKAYCAPALDGGWRPGFEAWRVAPDRLDDHRDPRCLPFQVFEADPEVPDLDSEEERAAFEEPYDSRSSRCDLGRRAWKLNPRDFHGFPPALRIAGVELPVGTHWDVEAEAKGVTTLVTSTEVWRIPRDDYLNVAANAHVRCAHAKSAAKRIFP